MPITAEEGGSVIYSTLQYIHDLRCTNTGSVYRIKAPYGAPRGQKILRSSRKDRKVTFWRGIYEVGRALGEAYICT